MAKTAYKFNGSDLEVVYYATTGARKYGNKKIQFTYEEKGNKEGGCAIADVFQRTFNGTYKDYYGVGGSTMVVKFIDKTSRDEAFDTYNAEVKSSLDGKGPADLHDWTGKNGEKKQDSNSALSGNTLYIIGAVAVVALIAFVIWKRRKKP